MGADTKIEWCDHTFNPWVGCTKVSPACDHCYAEAWAKRSGHPELWTGQRRRTTDANWREPGKWAARARAEGVRQRVFCASLADVFDNQVPDEWRHDLFRLIWDTRDALDWLLLTKRPQNIADMIEAATAGTAPLWAWPWPNVWLGTTVENQPEADRRIPHLLAVQARVHFLSCEPLLGPIDMTSWLDQEPSIGWVIAGGESGGPSARPAHPDWFRSLIRQCRAADIPFFFKQWGDWQPTGGYLCAHLYPSGTIGDGPYGLKAAGQEPGHGCSITLKRVGKKNAGRTFYGVQYSEFPQ